MGRTAISTPFDSSMSDVALLARFAGQQNQAAFAELLQRHGPMVLGVCRRILHNRDDADDAFQATFLALAMQARTTSPPRLPQAWLHHVATRSAHAIRAKRARQTALERILIRLRQFNPVARPPDVEMRLVIDEQINALPQRYRQVIVLCLLGGKSKREAAAELGWAEGTVASRLQQGRELLRRRLSRLKLCPEEKTMNDPIANDLQGVTVPPLLAMTTLHAAQAIIAGKLVAGIASIEVMRAAESLTQPILLTKPAIAAGIVFAVGIATATGAAHLRSTDAARAPMTASEHPTNSAAALAPAPNTESSIGTAAAVHAAAPAVISASTGSMPSTPARIRSRAPVDSRDSSRQESRRTVAAQGMALQITGTVIDIDAHPVDGAVIMLSPTLANRDPKALERIVRSDSRGEFEIANCIGDYLIHAMSVDHTVTRHAVAVSAGGDVTVQLAPNAARMITGRVTDTDGNPIQADRSAGFGSARAADALSQTSGVLIRILVELTPNSGNYRAVVVGTDMTDASGDYTVQGFFPDTRFRVSISANGYESWLSEFQDAPNVTGQIEMPDIQLKRKLK